MYAQTCLANVADSHLEMGKPLALLPLGSDHEQEVFSYICEVAFLSYSTAKRTCMHAVYSQKEKEGPGQSPTRKQTRNVHEPQKTHGQISRHRIT